MADPARRVILPAPVVPPPGDRAPVPMGAEWCRGLVSHPWQLLPPMVVVSKHTVRLTFYCPRCETTRQDRWQQKTGAIEGRYYKHSEHYTELLKTDRSKMRVGLMHKGRPQPISVYQRTQLGVAARVNTKGATDEGTGQDLRLVSTKRKARARDQQR